jgi:histidinol-phosphate aminotransferase
MEIFLELQRRGVIARPLAQAGIANGLRVTVGLEDENRRFISALEEILALRPKKRA